MLVEGQVKFFNPQSTAEDSQEDGVAVFSKTIEMNGDKDSRCEGCEVKPMRAHSIKRAVFPCYLKSDASSRHQGTRFPFN